MTKPRKTAKRSCGSKQESALSPPAVCADRSPADEDIVPAKFSFAFRAAFIPRRARKTQTELFLGHDFASLRRPNSGVEVAFRVTFPHRRWDYQKDFEILAYKDTLWWPLCMLCWEWEGHLSEQDFLTELESGNWNLLFTFAGLIGDPTRPRPSRKVEDLIGARDISSNWEIIASKARKLAHENFVLFGGKAWVRGGEPVYLNSSHWTYEAVAANPGADRSPRPWADGPNKPPGDFESGQRAIREGNFRTADRYDEADAIAREHSARAPHIDVLMPNMLRLVPARARLDAIFRMAFLFSLWAHKNRGSALDDRLIAITDSIIDAADEKGDDLLLDETRLRALKPLSDFIGEKGLPERPITFETLRWDLRPFWSDERRFVVKALKRQKLAHVDDVALGRLADLG